MNSGLIAKFHIDKIISMQWNTYEVGKKQVENIELTLTDSNIVPVENRNVDKCPNPVLSPNPNLKTEPAPSDSSCNKDIPITIESCDTNQDVFRYFPLRERKPVVKLNIW